jgi:hypothetical protein
MRRDSIADDTSPEEQQSVVYLVIVHLLGRSLAAGQEKVLDVLSQELPAARKIPRDQRTGGDPVLN